jgi:hypothetical protein
MLLKLKIYKIMNIKKSINALNLLGLPSRDSEQVSTKRFSDGAQYRVEIPSTEGPKAFQAVLDEARRLQCPLHRVSQGSGVQMLSDAEIREMAKIGAGENIEVCLFLTPRASFDIGGMWNAPSGRVIGWQARGANQVQYALDEIYRVIDLGIRSVLIADWGIIKIVADLRKKNVFPHNLLIKSSAIMAPANPASAQLLEEIGTDTINVATDLNMAQLSAIRQVTKAPLDIYVEAPDGLGGFVRHHETPDMIRFAAPMYVKLGVRNSPDIYPSGQHMENVLLQLSRERVRRSKLVIDLIQREMPEAVISKPGKHADLAVPEL